MVVKLEDHVVKDDAGKRLLAREVVYWRYGVLPFELDCWATMSEWTPRPELVGLGYTAEPVAGSGSGGRSGNPRSPYSSMDQRHLVWSAG